MTAVWVILGLVGLCGVGYAIHLAIDSTPAEPVASANNTAVVTPTAPTDDHFGEDPLRIEDLRQRIKARSKRVDIPARDAVAPKAQPEPPVEVVVEPDTPAPAPENPAAFQDGSAFDRPAVDSSRTRRNRGGSREFGSYQAPASRRQAQFSDRPNQPDASFDDPPADRPMMKKGARR